MSTPRRFVALAATAAFLAAVTGACGGSDSTPTSPTTQTPTTPSTPGTTVTITSSGVSPRDITAAVGSRITFVNNDSQPHDMSSDPHPAHTDCPEINVGFVAAGQSRATNNLTTARTCTYHDHNQPSTTSLQGTIRIQ